MEIAACFILLEIMAHSEVKNYWRSLHKGNRGEAARAGRAKMGWSGRPFHACYDEAKKAKYHVSRD
jgi:hypothetical protein